MGTPLRPVIPVLLVLIGGALSPSRAQTTDDLFDESVVHTLRITMHSRDWADLRANFTRNDYYPADVAWNGIRARNVGIRSRGLGSRSAVKPGLQVDFDHYSSRGTFLGMRALVLDNLTTDPSMLRERVAMAFYRRLGIPAPREVHANLYVNGDYAGVYVIVEPVDTVFLQRNLGETGGALYEYHFMSSYYATFLGEDLDLYPPLFEPRTQETRSTFDLFDPIRELFRAINSTPAESFREAVGARLDLESTLRLIASEAFMAEWDGILGYEGMNNFYLYRPESSLQAKVFPWDADHTFQAADYPLLAGAVDNVLMRRILEDRDLRARFFELVNEAIASATTDDWLIREVISESQQIRDSVLGDAFKPYTNEEFDAAFADLLNFARARAAFAALEVRRNQ